ncbi:hypothetical protein AAHA92_07446 [Salvia divinorum]|uniref:Uncharacterized protein n=1 Tax=Salvia divinorum TaxID=28513 RepID=A0ABD1IBH7_SALDI
MRNNRTRTLFFLFLILLHLHSTSPLHVASAKPQSRKLPLSANSLSVDTAGSRGCTVQPETAVRNGLRKRPPTASNPSHNK